MVIVAQLSGQFTSFSSYLSTVLLIVINSVILYFSFPYRNRHLKAFKGRMKIFCVLEKFHQGVPCSSCSIGRSWARHPSLCRCHGISANAEKEQSGAMHKHMPDMEINCCVIATEKTYPWWRQNTSFHRCKSFINFYAKFLCIRIFIVCIVMHRLVNRKNKRFRNYSSNV